METVLISSDFQGDLPLEIQAIYKAINERKRAKRTHTPGAPYTCTSGDLTAVTPVIRSMSYRITKGDLWTEDLINTGLLQYNSSRKIGYSESQSLSYSYRIMQSDYFRNLINPVKNTQSIVDRVQEHEYDQIKSIDRNLDEKYLLFDILSKCKDKTDKQIILDIATGYNQTEVASKLEISQPSVNKRIQKIRDNYKRHAVN